MEYGFEPPLRRWLLCRDFRQVFHAQSHQCSVICLCALFRRKAISSAVVLYCIQLACYLLCLRDLFYFLWIAVAFYSTLCINSVLHQSSKADPQEEKISGVSVGEDRWTAGEHRADGESVVSFSCAAYQGITVGIINQLTN